MRARLARYAPVYDAERNLLRLKIIAVVTPSLFVLLVELLTHGIFDDILSLFWLAPSLFVVVGVAAYFFSKSIFATIERQQKENKSRMRELEAMSEIREAVDEFYNLDALLHRAMDKVIQITAADSGELYLFDNGNSEQVRSLHAGISNGSFGTEIQLQLKEMLISRGTRLDQKVILEDPGYFPNGKMASLVRAGLRSLAIIPLKSSEGMIGAICLLSRKPDHFKPDEAKLLLQMGYRVAVAIENARLYEKVQASAVIEERERISKELHDGLAQVLGYVITKSQATRQVLRKMTMANDYLVELENMAQEVYTDTREAILGLRTASSGDRSMVSALRQYALRFKQMNNIKTELIVGDRIIPALSPQTELQAIRIVQEALSNVRKHAEATSVKIRITAGIDNVTILVEDDGKGFDVEKSGRGDWTQFGLRNMRERASSIHSRLIIESMSEIGTKVTLIIPLNPSSLATKEGEAIESTDSR